MIVADTSAWIELFRATGSAADRTLTRRLETDEEVVVTEAVVMEVLAGARSPRQLEELRVRLLEFPVLPLHGLPDYEAAAELYRDCQRAGETIRELTDCLVAVPAIRAGASVLHADRDFEVLARHTPLRLEPLDG